MAIGRHPLRGLINGVDGSRRSKRLTASVSRFSTLHRVKPSDDSREGTPFSMYLGVDVLNTAGLCLFTPSFRW
jgi:hypothetical protein